MVNFFRSCRRKLPINLRLAMKVALDRNFRLTYDPKHLLVTANHDQALKNYIPNLGQGFELAYLIQQCRSYVSSILTYQRAKV